MPRRWFPLILGLAFVTGLAAMGFGGQGQDDELAKELPRIPPTEPEAALKTFKIHAGFRIEPFAVEPLITDPVAAAFDAEGRLYVVEMRGYPFPEKVPSGNITLLDDTDGDGQADKSTIFIDGLSWPTGVVPYDGGVFIASAPDLLYAKDTNGDGRADIKKVVFTGFGTRNVEGLLNNLIWGPDGWIYGVSGDSGGEVKNLTRPDAPSVAIRNRDFRFKPDGSAFEAISGGGQFGQSFDDWGHRFTCNNSNHIRQIVLPSHYLERNPTLVVPAVLTDIAVEGGAAPVFRISPPEPWRVVRTRQRAADPNFVRRASPTELVPTGFFTSATGVTIYRGTAFPPEFWGNAFIGEVAGNLVDRKILTKHGAIFEARRADPGTEFLASTDNWFRPDNFVNTPDGTLLVLDMYRETVEHPDSLPPPIKKHLDLTSGRDKGRIYHIIPEHFRRRRRPALTRAKTSELVDLLADRDAWWRETAQRLLIERQDPAAIPLLRQLARQRPTALGRMHALWTLDILGGLNEDDLLLALSDAEPFVRERSAPLSERWVGRSEALRAALLALAHDPDAMVRFQAAFSIGAIAGPEAIEALATIAERDVGDPWTRAAVLSSVAGRPRALIEALAAKKGIFDSEPGRVWLGELATLVGAENQESEIEALLMRFAAAEADPSQALAALLGLGRGLWRSGGSLRERLEGPAGQRLLPLFERAAKIVANGDEAARLDAIRLLGLGPSELALSALPPLLDARYAVALQLAALQALADLPERRVANLVIEHWKALSPSARREAAEVLFTRPERLQALLDAIDSGAISSAELDPSRRAALLTHRDSAIRDRAGRLLGDSARSDRAKVIAVYHKALNHPGDPERGRQVFRRACATCHKAEGQGQNVGPDLATITNRGPADLLVQILDPNREVAPTYVNYTVATTDGRVLSGLIAEESATTVMLKRAEGAADVVPRAQIAEIASTGLSLMPEGLERDIDPPAMADLIAYLRGLAASATTSPGSPKPTDPKY
jgi:putative membrane-bound dehydrogenase-like protein